MPGIVLSTLPAKFYFIFNIRRMQISHMLIILPKLTAYMQQCQKSRPGGFLTIILNLFDSYCLMTENLPAPLERSSFELCGQAFPLPLLPVLTAVANDPKRLHQFAVWVIYLFSVLMTHAIYLIMGLFFHFINYCQYTRMDKDIMSG